MRGINLQTFKKEKVWPNSTNHLTVSRTSIKGAFAIDPYLNFDSFRSETPASERGSRRNLELTAKNGPIDVEIFLYLMIRNRPPLDGPTAVDLDMLRRGDRTVTLPLIAKIHTTDGSRHVFHLTVSGLDGYHSLYLPPSFRGPVEIDLESTGKLDRRVSVSAGFARGSRVIQETCNDERDTRTYFVGERDVSGQGNLDKVNVHVRKGNVRLQFVGERDWYRIRRLLRKLGL